jgi:hypothetical protein
VSNTGRPRWVCAALAGRDAADHLGAVGDRLLGVEGAGLAGDPLGDDLGVRVDEDAIALQASSSSFTASTETWKLAFASSFSSISTIARRRRRRSRTGTPT